MDGPGQALQDKTVISPAPREFGVDTPVTLPRTGDNGDETPSSEYPLNFKIVLVPWMGGDELWTVASSARLTSTAEQACLFV